jgi:hypothetical protein
VSDSVSGGLRPVIPPPAGEQKSADDHACLPVQDGLLHVCPSPVRDGHRIGARAFRAEVRRLAEDGGVSVPQGPRDENSS